MLRGERFELNQTETALVGQRSGRALRLGDPITVRVDRSRRRAAGSTSCRETGATMAKGSKGKRSARKPASGDVATNRRAGHKFELLEKFEAGSSCVGTEVKSLREGKAQISDAYAVIERGEVWLRNAHIPPYAPAASAEPRSRAAAQAAPAPPRDRAPGRAASERGLTLIPTRIYFKGPRAKVELALARGKQQPTGAARSATATSSARSSASTAGGFVEGS